MLSIEISLFTAIVTVIAASVEECHMVLEPLCIYCDKRIYIQSQCVNSTSKVKILKFFEKIDIDYKSYTNRSIKMIIEPRTTTYYSCETYGRDYLQVFSDNAYPLGVEIRLLHVNFEDSNTSMDTSFQKCLVNHCLQPFKNDFYCYNDIVISFNFVPNSVVSLPCLRNITMAFLKLDVLNITSMNNFFRYAYNIIRLTLTAKNSLLIPCNAFYNLPELRDLMFQIHNSTGSENFGCIFKYNRNLVKIDLNGQMIWNSCNYNVINYTNVTEIDNNPGNYRHRNMLIYVVVTCCLLFCAALYARYDLKKSLRQHYLRANELIYLSTMPINDSPREMTFV